MSYSAIVSKIKVKPHPNADKLQIGECYGFQVIVGLDTQDNELGVFFPCDGQLSDEFCIANDLYPRYNEEDKKVGGGFIEPKHRRVKAQSFRGAKSFGFYVPLSYFEYCDVNDDWFKEGKEFTEINGKQICNKYETQQTKSKQSKTINHRRETNMFPMHFETKQFLREIDAVDLAKVDDIVITEKLHGTSFRIGHVLEDRKLNWLEKLLLKFKVKIQTKEWQYLNGSRRVILEKSNGSGYYGSDDFRYDAVYRLNGRLHKGEIIYGEIVGYVNEHTPIMNTVNTDSLQDKQFKKQYGKEMTFSYGCDVGQREIYVYRIVNINEDGIQQELTWNQVKNRCMELGVKFVPELYNLSETYLRIMNSYTKNLYEEEVMNDLKNRVENLIQGSSTIDSRHIREGVCVRLESAHKTQVLKAKSFEFYVLEGVLKDKGVEDLEESN